LGHYQEPEKGYVTLFVEEGDLALLGGYRAIRKDPRDLRVFERRAMEILGRGFLVRDPQKQLLLLGVWGRVLFGGRGSCGGERNVGGHC